MLWLLPSLLAAAESGAIADAGALDPSDPIAQVYGRRPGFVDGQPLITVRVLEGAASFAFRPAGAFRAKGRGAEAREAGGPGRGRWTVRVADAKPGRSVARVHVGEHLFEDVDGAEEDARFFRTHGYRVSLVSVGSVYGIAGRTVDTRRVLVLVEGDGSEKDAQRLAKEIDSRFGGRPSVHREVIERGRGTVELVSADGTVVLRSPDALTIEVVGNRGLEIERVEHSMGYANHGFENRSYRGPLVAVVDASGGVAAVNVLPLETLAKGIVPSEIFASAHTEALKAQAVTARGEILAKIGARHVGDPYLLCAEQHCQVYRGVGGEHPRTNAAVEATRGEALFAAGGGSLVPTYYSAVCGGHTEDNDAVWGGPPDPSIRGRPDFPVTEATMAFSDGIGEALLRRWLAADVPAYCRSSSKARRAKFRWERSFSQKEVDEIARPFKVGTVTALEVEGRGISGRARTLVIRGTRGEAKVHSELSIRRLFRMLNSGMFVIDVEGKGASRRWIFRGGGWGHGAGMCQMGAIGRAEQGATYRAIVQHYYGGAEVVRMYD